jgi:hypothetical protein
LQIFVDDQPVVDITVPGDGQLHPITVPARAWPAGPQRVRLIAPEGTDTPLALGLGRDARPLSLGFGPIRWEPAP